MIGENIWKWRLENHLNKKSFEDFDLFTDKIIQLLNKREKPIVFILFVLQKKHQQT